MFLLIPYVPYRVTMFQSYLHSTMFLLIRCGSVIRINKVPYLHSTMFLLILLRTIMQAVETKNLHSTMFLLIRFRRALKASCHVYLHSTMFLLIPVISSRNDAYSVFTFHNVSINSRSTQNHPHYRLDLHSTMFLLIPFGVSLLTAM